jgi:hypothetical protein
MNKIKSIKISFYKKDFYAKKKNQKALKIKKTIKALTYDGKQCQIIYSLKQERAPQKKIKEFFSRIK